MIPPKYELNPMPVQKMVERMQDNMFYIRSRALVLSLRLEKNKPIKRQKKFLLSHINIMRDWLNALEHEIQDLP